MVDIRRGSQQLLGLQHLPVDVGKVLKQENPPHFLLNTTAFLNESGQLCSKCIGPMGEYWSIRSCHGSYGMVKQLEA